jgi:hypothetical protein
MKEEKEEDFLSEVNPVRYSKGWSESRIEEVIACLWTILWVILWTHNAPVWSLLLVGAKALLNHLCSIGFAILELRIVNK